METAGLAVVGYLEERRVGSEVAAARYQLEDARAELLLNVGHRAREHDFRVVDKRDVVADFFDRRHVVR